MMKYFLWIQGQQVSGLETVFSRARMREEPIPHGFAVSAISAVKNPG